MCPLASLISDGNTALDLIEAPCARQTISFSLLSESSLGFLRVRQCYTSSGQTLLSFSCLDLVEHLGCVDPYLPSHLGSV